MIKRREFLQRSLAGMAAAGFPLINRPAVVGATELQSPSTSLAPRRVELLDADWRFLAAPLEQFTLSITDWLWTPGSADQEAAMIAPNMDTSTWKQTTSGVDTLSGLPGGWYRTVLPSITGPGRTVHFDCVDDNGTVYLNGQRLTTHQGYASAFDVALDPAWNNAGPNILTVYVQNLNGPGGITKPVTAGTVTPIPDYSGLSVRDKNWRVVHLPHDYVVEGAFDPQGDTGHGALPVTTAWYRRYIDIKSSDRGKSIWLYFEGVFRNATVYVNGIQLFFQDDGYDPFFVDIASALNYGGPNVVAVSLDPRGGEGWWYEGGGIYRHVWLNVADPVHVAPWGVYVTSDVSNVTTTPSAALTIATELTNSGSVDASVSVQTAIVGPDGATVATTSWNTTVPAGAGVTTQVTANVPSVQLWSLESRSLYLAQTSVLSGGKVIDRFDQKFGIRTIRFDPNNGFFLNEKSVKLQGVCNHQDFVGVGIGMPDSILYWRMKQLRDKLGCNAIRCSHNAMTTAMYDACDDLGLLVMDETRHPGDAVETKASDASTVNNTDHVEKMVRRDRSHPSVIMWSMGNEEWTVQGDPHGAVMLTALMTAVHKHDTTRPVTTATNMGNGNGWLVGFGSVEDLLGVNYNYGSYDWLHQQYPNKPIFGSETASDVTCRGIYTTDAAAGHITSYHSPEGNWEPLGSREYVLGGFAWTGFDYRGEPSPYPWPEISSNFGLLDLCGFPKDIAYYYKAWWKQDTPSVYIFPHWNWAGKEGQTLPIWCFSNCERVELFVNGVSQGAQDMPKFRHVEWNNVIYQPGSINVVGYIGGQSAATQTITTTGAPAAVRLVVDRTLLTADGEDTLPVAVEIVDAQGLVVPTANNQVTFSVFGAGANAGVGNGDPASHELNQGDTRSAFNGLCMVLVKSATKPGGIVVQASSPGLTTAQLNLQTTS